MANPRDHRIGDATITRIGEITADFPAPNLLSGWTDANAAIGATHGLTAAEIASGQLGISVHTWLVRTGRHIILIDTGVGNGKPRKSAIFNDLHTDFLDHLATAGVAPGDVTHVLLTHLHTDHVGWNTVKRAGRWTPTFPNARTIMPRLGYDWFTSGPGREAAGQDMFHDSVLPVIKAQTVDFVPSEGGEILDGIAYHPTPGHSPDHMSIILQSQGGQALFAGDLLHHPVQVSQPELNSTFCADPALARTSRTWALQTAAQRGMTWFSSHFHAPSAGHVSQHQDGFRWLDA